MACPPRPQVPPRQVPPHRSLPGFPGSPRRRRGPRGKRWVLTSPGPPKGGPSKVLDEEKNAGVSFSCFVFCFSLSLFLCVVLSCSVSVSLLLCLFLMLVSLCHSFSFSALSECLSVRDNILRLNREPEPPPPVFFGLEFDQESARTRNPPLLFFKTGHSMVLPMV